MINKSTMKRSLIMIVIFVALLIVAIVSQNIDTWMYGKGNVNLQVMLNQDQAITSEPSPKDLISINNVKTSQENGYWHITYDVINNSKQSLSYGDGVIYFRDDNGQQVGSDTLVFSNILSGGKVTEELYISKDKFTHFKDYITKIEHVDFK